MFNTIPLLINSDIRINPDEKAIALGGEPIGNIKSNPEGTATKSTANIGEKYHSNP